MNVSFKQQDRLGSLATALGKDTLNLLRFTGTDHVNDLFDYTVEALSTDPDINFDAILGTHATVTIQSDQGPRHFDGIVTQARWAGAGENGNRYNLTLKPWFWLASRRRNQRIFHGMTVVQIIEKLLSPYAALGKPALNVSLTGSYPTLEYTVQYRESDMAFAMRLMERFGISYHFTHDAGSHTMVLTDSMVSHSPLPGGSRLYKPHDGQDMVHEEHIRSWHADRRLTTGAVRLTDYNFKTPNAAMEVDRVGDAVYAEGQIESYDYPGDYLDQSQGKDVVGLRTEQERGQDQRINALGDCVSLGSGMMLTLSGKEAPKGKYLCLTATHAFTAESYGTGGSQSTDHGYTASYVLMPETTPLAPERTTRIPTVQGPQTAVVVGEGEIDCDEYGRILVHFHWDLEKQYSMRCRVSQNWASKGWGGMVIPRIGMEVVVEFLEGDPDKPLVTGCVYNGKNDVPYELPKHKTRSTFKTDTHKGTGFNELRFEDENGEEEIFIHAQKDLTEKVEHNASKRVNNNDLTSIGGSKLEAVRWNSKELVGLNYFLNVGGGKTGDVFNGANPEGLRSKAYELTDDLNATEAFGNITETCSGNRYNGVAGNQSESIGAAYAVNVGSGMTLRVGTDATFATGGTARFTTTGDHLTTVGGKSITLVDGDIILSNQNGGIVIKANGEIIISGKSLDIETSGDTKVKSSNIFLN